ncbi:MAG: NifU family protein [Phycisphaerales bacterium]|nr:NifU family protein [Phycisphaerae bacterium]NNF45078.1 NifU family protein [Phycisphaerales bacterium]NNM24371.1 NifU family protein [Phycisphaerales bacterium]
MQKPATESEPRVDPLRERVAAILDLIRPAIQDDGGDLELVEVRDDGIVVLRFHGACVGCPSSNITLQGGIERQLRDRIPEVNGVETVS